MLIRESTSSSTWTLTQNRGLQLFFSPFSGWKVLSFRTGGIGEEAHFGNERKTLGTKQKVFSLLILLLLLQVERSKSRLSNKYRRKLIFLSHFLDSFFLLFSISKVQKKIFATDDLRMNTDAQSGQSPARIKLLKLHFSFLFLSGKLGHVGPPGIRLRRLHRHGRGVLDVVHPKPHGHQHRQV